MFSTLCRTMKGMFADNRLSSFREMGERFWNSMFPDVPSFLWLREIEGYLLEVCCTNNLGDDWQFFCYLRGKYVWIIGLKAPANYPGHFWFNHISVLLWERPKHRKFMISVFLDPWDPLLTVFNIPNYFKQYNKPCGNLFKYYFCKSGNLKAWQM